MKKRGIMNLPLILLAILGVIALIAIIWATVQSTKTITISDAELNAGKSFNLAAGQKAKFNVYDEKHVLEITGEDENNTEITLTDEEGRDVTLDIIKNLPQTVDTNNDGEEDIIISIEKNENNETNLKIIKPNTCGNGICEGFTCHSIECPPPENKENCPSDCKTDSDNCNFVCNENIKTPTNCELPDETCENGCEDGECLDKPSTCGNGICEKGEFVDCSEVPIGADCAPGLVHCVEDCGSDDETCGNGVCDSNEIGPYVIHNNIDPSEGKTYCPGDCPASI